MNTRRMYPYKTVLNLYQRDIPAGYYRNLVLLALFLIVSVVAFARFAVLDRFKAATAAELEASRKRSQYQSLRANNAIYQNVLDEYERNFSALSANTAYVDVMSVLQLVEENLISSAELRSLSLTGNSLSVILSGISLEQASAIMNILLENEQVSSVSVSSIDATREAENLSQVAMTIRLRVEGALR